MLELQEFFPTMSPVPIGIPNSDAFLQVKGDMIEHIYALRRVPGQVKPPGFFCHRPADEMPPFVYWVDIHKPKDDQQFHQAIYDMMTWNTDFRKDLQLLAIHPSRDPRLIGAEIVPLEPTIQPTAVQKAIEALGYRLNQLPKVNFRNDQHALTTPAPESTITGIILQSNPQITPQTQAPMQWSQRKRDHSVESTFGAFKGWLSKRVRTQSGSRPQPDCELLRS
jgi:hypothetical protein